MLELDNYQLPITYVSPLVTRISLWPIVAYLSCSDGRTYFAYTKQTKIVAYLSCSAGRMVFARTNSGLPRFLRWSHALRSDQYQKKGAYLSCSVCWLHALCCDQYITNKLSKTTQRTYIFPRSKTLYPDLPKSHCPKVPWSQSAIIPKFYGPKVPWSWSPMVPKPLGPNVLWLTKSCGPKAQSPMEKKSLLSQSPMVSNSHGPKSPWSHSPMVHWSEFP